MVPVRFAAPCNASLSSIISSTVSTDGFNDDRVHRVGAAQIGQEFTQADLAKTFAELDKVSHGYHLPRSFGLHPANSSSSCPGASAASHALTAVTGRPWDSRVRRVLRVVDCLDRFPRADPAPPRPPRVGPPVANMSCCFHCQHVLHPLPRPAAPCRALPRPAAPCRVGAC